MAFPIGILLVEPEMQSVIFVLVNGLALIYALLFIVSSPYIWIYLIVHLTIFYIINKRIASGRFYASNKSLNNQTVIVTGAATGIGRITALELAKLQAHVIVGIRGQQRAEQVAEELSKESHGNVVGYHLDLSDLASVKAFSEKIDKVDILINNAGVFKHHRELTKDGLETTFGTNHKSKLANILHAVELQRRYGNQGIRAYSLHPGGILSTEINRENTSVQALSQTLFNVASKTIAQGAMTTLFCALSNEAQPGKYHSNCRVAQPSAVAYSSKKAQELWELSERIINEKQ